MATALILGVNSQDGSYLADALVERGHRVIGVARGPQPCRPWRLDRFRYVRLDLIDANGLAALLAAALQDVAFHVAAVHGAIGAGFTY